VGIEGDYRQYRNKQSFLESVGVYETGRHRPFQFTQWTIASHQSHPILVDCVRRIMDTAVVAKALSITHTRLVEAYRSAGRTKMARAVEMAPKPWVQDRKGEVMDVQEWTGPAVFTDSVMSYLGLIAGIRESDLYGLKHPVQIGDVVVLPIDGYNPMPKSLPNPVARAIHLFRGKWKSNWDPNNVVHL